MFLAKNLIHLRAYYKHSLSFVANKIGVTHPTLAKYEKGETNPPIDIAAQLANHYKVSLDVLFYHPLSKLSSNQFQSVISSPEQIFRGQSLQVREIVHTISLDNQELIEIVPFKAIMGYSRGGYKDMNFIDELPKFSLPLPYVHTDRKYRLFPAEGDSMLPIQDGSYILGEYVNDWYSIRDGVGYVFVLQDDGIVFKKAINQLALNKRFGLESLNPNNTIYYKLAEEIREIWKYTMHMSNVFPDPEPSLQLVLSELKQLKAGQEELLKHVA